MFPQYWIKFVKTNNLIGSEFEIDEKSDLSELGGVLKIMKSEQSIEEATELYPGIIAIKKHFIPVAMCLEGSGDYYYINTNDGQSGPLYRIYHDSVEEDGISENGFDKILDDYEHLLLYKSS